MKTLKLAHELVAPIIGGSKTSTWRLFDEKNLSTGDEIELLEKESGKRFATAVITSVREKALGELGEEDYDGHRRYESEEALLAELRRFYGDRVNVYTQVKIVKFRLSNIQ